MRNFKELKIWQKGFQIAVSSYKITETFPVNERFGLISQINRAAVSVPSNIAEGSSRKSEKDYFRFIEISLGSAFELETQIIIAEKLNKGNQQLLQDLKMEVADEQRMLTGFQHRLNL